MSSVSNKILILGSEGFIGKNLVSGLLKRNYEIFGADLIDLKPKTYSYFRIGRLQPEFDQLFQKQHFDYCINVAGSGSVPISISEPNRDFEANVSDTFKLLNAMRLYNSNCRYIHFSSAAVYGNPKQLPIKETNILSPVSPYGYHKWISEITCKEFFLLFKIPTVILRPFSAYGPGLRKQLIWDLYQKFKNDERIFLQGTGNETRDFIYIDDIIEAISTIIRANKFDGEIFNIASGKSTTIKKVSEIFSDILGNSKEIFFDNVLDDGNPLFWEADISKIHSLGFKPLVSLEKGLRSTIEWLQANG